MRRSFESSRAKQEKKIKIHSLTFCDLQVSKAFEQHKERKIGGKVVILEREEKRVRAKAEVEKFLKLLPPQVSFLKEIYCLAQQKLSQKEFIEEELERIEEKIEMLLFKNSPAEEKDKAKDEVKRKYEFRNKEEFFSIWQLKLVKLLREKYKIPYISVFYY